MIKRVSTALLLLFTCPLIKGQTVRDLQPPVAVKEPLTNSTDAARLFYLTLATMSGSDRTSVLKRLALTDAEVPVVSTAATNFQANHNANSQAYATLALNTQNTDTDLTAYMGRANTLLQQAQTSISSNISPASMTALTNAIEAQRLGSSVYKFYVEIAGDSGMVSGTRANPAFKLAAYHPMKRLPNCPDGQPPNPIISISVSLSGSAVLNTSDGTNFTMTMTGSGSYTGTWNGGYTCAEPQGFTFNIQDTATFTNGLGNIAFTGASSSFCGHPTNGPVDLSAITSSTFTDSSQDIGGSYEFDLDEIADGIKSVVSKLSDYFEFAYTWSFANGIPTIDAKGNYFYPVTNWCSNGTPDWNPKTVEDSSITKAGDRFFITGNFMVRPCNTCYWIGAAAPFGAGGITLLGVPGPLMTHECTHSGPQP